MESCCLPLSLISLNLVPTTWTFIASDGELSDSELVTITVIEAGNQPPVFEPIEPKSVSEGQSLTFTVSATDPEGTTPIVSAFNLPLNAAVTDSGNGRLLFAFNPDFAQSGVYTVTFVASDGERADSERRHYRSPEHKSPTGLGSYQRR